MCETCKGCDRCEKMLEKIHAIHESIPTNRLWTAEVIHYLFDKLEEGCRKLMEDGETCEGHKCLYQKTKNSGIDDAHESQ